MDALSGMAIREQIGRFKYISESEMAHVYETLLEALTEEIKQILDQSPGKIPGGSQSTNGKEGLGDAERI